ncbi:MAG: alpha/beta hydrolase [Candidatus Hydrogenedentes bacterium]|nr:alpha/beta hydrolase [Candidatus Hydrogenedentota bacterium]
MNRPVRCALTVVAVAVFLVALPACGPRYSLKNPPPPPEGFASYDEAMAAVLGGKVKLIAPPSEAPDTVREIKDIEYGNVGGRALLLDLYLPLDTHGPVPGLIFIHGGGWKKGDRKDYLYYTAKYAEQGYAAATISYRFSGEAPFPAAVEDAKCAVRWMRANAAEYGIDPDAIAVLGGSAGGHLAMMVGYSSDVPELEGDGGHAGVSSRVQAVVNLYGPSDLTAEIAKDSGEVRSFLGVGYAEAPELYAKASPLTYLSKDDPPTLILHGTIDELVPVEQSDVLAQKLEALGVPVVYDRLEGWPHTMDRAEAVNERCRFFMDRFFKRYLR